jgi:hypothetical protein
MTVAGLSMVSASSAAKARHGVCRPVAGRGVAASRCCIQAVYAVRTARASRTTTAAQRNGPATGSMSRAAAVPPTTAIVQ